MKNNVFTIYWFTVIKTLSADFQNGVRWLMGWPIAEDMKACLHECSSITVGVDAC